MPTPGCVRCSLNELWAGGRYACQPNDGRAVAVGDVEGHQSPAIRRNVGDNARDGDPADLVAQPGKPADQPRRRGKQGARADLDHSRLPRPSLR